MCQTLEVGTVQELGSERFRTLVRSDGDGQGMAAVVSWRVP